MSYNMINLKFKTKNEFHPSLNKIYYYLQEIIKALIIPTQLHFNQINKRSRFNPINQ